MRKDIKSQAHAGLAQYTPGRLGKRSRGQGVQLARLVGPGGSHLLQHVLVFPWR